MISKRNPIGLVASVQSLDIQRHRSRRAHIFTSALVIICSACSIVPWGGKKRVVGTLNSGGLPEWTLKTPATITAGQDFVVTVVTLGSGCASPDGAEVQVNEMTIAITPYDRIPKGSFRCEKSLQSLPRNLTLRFDAPGLITIRVIGVNFAGERATVESQIRVRP